MELHMNIYIPQPHVEHMQVRDIWSAVSIILFLASLFVIIAILAS
jgi:hypothetical protein